MRILIDYDDVLFPLIPNWVEALNNKHGTNVSPDDITDWNIAQFFPNLTHKQVFEPLGRSEFQHSRKPYPNSVEAVSNLIANGHEVKIVTATHYNNVKSKAECLLKHFPFLSWDDVIITSNKQSIKGDVLIDDAPHNLEGGDCFKILVDAPHNWGYDEVKRGMVRATNIVRACKFIINGAVQRIEYGRAVLRGQIN